MWWLVGYVVGWVMCFPVAFLQMSVWYPRKEESPSNVAAAALIATVWPLVILLKVAGRVFGQPR